MERKEEMRGTVLKELTTWLDVRRGQREDSAEGLRRGLGCGQKQNLKKAILVRKMTSPLEILSLKESSSQQDGNEGGQG